MFRSVKDTTKGNKSFFRHFVFLLSKIRVTSYPRFPKCAIETAVFSGHKA